MNIKFNFIKLNFFIFFLLAILVLLGTFFRAKYHIDPHHWGLMLSNSKDLVVGRVPYREIFIQYGILTTIIHSISYYLFNNLMSIILVSGLFYSIGLYGLYKLSLLITNDKVISFLVLIVSFLFHPFAVYPWSNYIAFPFIIFGIYYLLKSKNMLNASYLFYSGVLLSLATLSRESIFPAILSIFLFFFAVDFHSKKSTPRYFLVFFAGFSFFIFLFFLYLMNNNSLSYWYKLSWLLPKIYLSEFFPHSFGFHGIINLLKSVFSKALNLDPRWILIAFVIIVNFYLFIQTLVKIIKKNQISDSECLNFKIAFASLVLLSSTLHIPEIFRFATGSIIGMLNLYRVIFFSKYTKYLLASFVIILSASFFNNSGLIFWPSKEIISSSRDVINIRIFSGQSWPEDTIKFYSSINQDLYVLSHSDSCKINYQFNSTLDNFLVTLSPFKQFQIAPFNVPAFDKLRPELNYRKKISDAKDIVIFRINKKIKSSSRLTEGDTMNFDIPKDFNVYSSYDVPKRYLYELGSELNIYAPKACVGKKY